MIRCGVWTARRHVDGDVMRPDSAYGLEGADRVTAASPA